MIDSSVQTEKLTIDEFMRLYDSEGPFEILDGERIDQVSTVFGHSEILELIVGFLKLFLVKNPIGTAYPESTFILPDADNPNWVKGSRIPDVMFISAERLAAYKAETENYKKKPLMIAPDLTIEIVSENDSYPDVTRKVRLYLQDGVRQVWVIDPNTQTVHVYEGEHLRNLTKADTLSGGEVIPGFEIPVSSLFE